jgi:ribosomal protein S18 acetylase RimI-like enzyme
MRFREASQTDADAIALLHAASWRTAYRGALSDTYLRGPIEAERIEVWRGRFEKSAQNQFVVVAESDHEMIGFVCAYGGHDEKWGTFLDNLHVAPEHKRGGVGAQLMGKLASWSIKAHPGQGIYLWVLESNLAAQRFYKRMGGENAGTDVWTPPDGSALPKIRIAWRDVPALLAICDAQTNNSERGQETNRPD